ncbi:MAG: hypothetical protein PVG41_10685 [Desulfobacteraceae bacterium]|jgi:hypothetical protein
MQKTLGILITSERHGLHLEEIVLAAKHKRIQLRVHVHGPAVRLCLKRQFKSALVQTEMTICRHSAKRFGILEKLEILYPEGLTTPQRPALDVGRCCKTIVL